MVFYYEQKEPIFNALFAFLKTTTIFGVVLKRPEFWIFVGGHCTAMALFKVGIWEAGELGELSATWEAISTSQMFMVFLLTFYNGRCYTRYLRLYDYCCQTLDGSIFFVQEVVVSLAPASAENHRIRAVKYTIAMLHIFFVGLQGGMKNKYDWREVVQKGLLTKLEAEQLQTYPSQSIETVLVVSTWTMQIIDKALEDDEFWGKRSMRIAHTHNRMSVYMHQLLMHMHKVGDELASPIPFQLYHLMNVCLIFNLFLLCTLSAVFQTYQTVFPLMISVMFFLGLREVAGNLSDPFHGRGFGSDFPIESFLQYAFDNSVCLLEAFRHGDPEHFARSLVAGTKDWTNDQMRHTTPNVVIYKPTFDAAVGSAFSWHKEFPLVTMAGKAAGPEKLLAEADMVPTEADYSRYGRKRKPKREKKEGPPKKPGFFARLFGKKVAHVNANNNNKPPEEELLDSEIRLAKFDKSNYRVSDEIEYRKAEVNTLKQLLQHRLSVGRDLNLPVDAIVTKALDKTELRDEAAERRIAPEFTTFDEARIIILDATEDQNHRRS